MVSETTNIYRKWDTTKNQRWIRNAKTMIRKNSKANKLLQKEKTFTCLSSLCATNNKNRRIHCIHKLLPHQTLRQKIPTQLHRLFYAHQCSIVDTAVFLNNAGVTTTTTTTTIDLPIRKRQEPQRHTTQSEGQRT